MQKHEEIWGKFGFRFGSTIKLGVDLDSVCGGRGICSRCQITPSFGEFSKHGVTVENNAISGWNSVEERYKSKRGMIDG